VARRQKRRRKEKKRPPRPRVEVLRSEDMKSVVQRARDAGLSDGDCANLDAIIDTLEWVSSELEDKTLTFGTGRPSSGLRGGREPP